MRYFTVVINRDKLNSWIATRKKNGAKISLSAVASKIGYGRSYISRLLSWEKYGRIEVSARFIGSFLKTFGLQFDEIFDVIPVNDKELKHPQERYEVFYQRNFKRQNGSNYYGA